jgi:hypothetical protein
MVPGVNVRLFMLELPLEILKRDQIIERVNIAGDQLGNCARFGASKGIWRQQGWLRMNFVKIFNNREGLNQDFAGR